MNHRVHRLEVNNTNIQERLEQFLNQLKGDVVAVFPNIIPTFQGMGATSKVDSLIIVEKIR